MGEEGLRGAVPLGDEQADISVEIGNSGGHVLHQRQVAAAEAARDNAAAVPGAVWATPVPKAASEADGVTVTRYASKTKPEEITEDISALLPATE